MRRVITPPHNICVIKLRNCHTKSAICFTTTGYCEKIQQPTPFIVARMPISVAISCVPVPCLVAGRPPPGGEGFGEEWKGAKEEAPFIGLFIYVPLCDVQRNALLSCESIQRGNQILQFRIGVQQIAYIIDRGIDFRICSGDNLVHILCLCVYIKTISLSICLPASVSDSQNVYHLQYSPHRVTKVLQVQGRQKNSAAHGIFYFSYNAHICDNSYFLSPWQKTMLLIF